MLEYSTVLYVYSPNSNYDRSTIVFNNPRRAVPVTVIFPPTCITVHLNVVRSSALQRQRFMSVKCCFDLLGSDYCWVLISLLGNGNGQNIFISLGTDHFNTEHKCETIQYSSEILKGAGYSLWNDRDMLMEWPQSRWADWRTVLYVTLDWR